MLGGGSEGRQCVDTVSVRTHEKALSLRPGEGRIVKEGTLAWHYYLLLLEHPQELYHNRVCQA